NQEVDKLRGTYEGLVKDLESEVAAGQIQIEQLRDGLRLDMKEDVLFASGSADVNAQGQQGLAKVAQRGESVPHRIEGAGHTEAGATDAPGSPTSGDPAAARATGVGRIRARRGAARARPSAVPSAEPAPIADNATAGGRARNRRIEITLKPVTEQLAA